MSILPCLHSVLTLPGALSTEQIVLPAVHGADDDAWPERPATAARCAVPRPRSPDRAPTAHVRRVRAGQGQARRRPARRPSARGPLGRRARPGPLSATAIGLTSRSESALDIAGPGRQASPRCSLAPQELGHGEEPARRRWPPPGNPAPWPGSHRNAPPMAGGGCRDDRPGQPRT
jgi:hypothetical protein